MCDAEMPSVYSDTMRTARKEHKCCECHLKIRKGDKYHHAKGCWDGVWQEFKTCESCDDLRHELRGTDCVYAPFEQLSEWADGADVPMPKAS